MHTEFHSAAVGRNPTRALAIVTLRQIPPPRRRLFNMSASIGRQHRKARIQTQIPEDARKTRRWRRARGSACCPMSATHAGRSNAWPTVCQPHRTICVLCVHLLTSALNPFLCRGVTGLAMRAETVSNCSQSQHRRSRRRSPKTTVRWRGRGNQPPVGVLPKIRREPRGFSGSVVQRPPRATE